jgi:phenylacetate-CoA ligase
MGRDEFLSWQQAQAWKMAQYHYDNNEFYKRKVGKYLPNRWEDLPLITKKDLQKPLHEIMNKGIALKDCYIGNTSGSSGHPFFFAKDKFTHAMTWASIKYCYNMYRIAINDKQARFYGIPMEFSGYWKEKIKDFAMNRMRFPVFDLSDKTMGKFLLLFSKNNYDYLYGYTNSLVIFARYIIKNDLVLKDICPSIRLCISTSEVCTQEDHNIIEKGFGVKHVREYGASEVGLIGFDIPDGSWRICEETVYNEVVDENAKQLPDGEIGNILCTSLFNIALPIIRYQIGDMIVLKGRSAKSIYRSIDRLMGRTNDTVILPSGKIAAGFTFYYISRSILEASGVLKEFIVRQTAVDHFSFEIVADRDLTHTEILQIKEKMALYLEPGLKLSINRVERINRPNSGKIKHFYSELNHN